jgi:hypothetical protein
LSSYSEKCGEFDKYWRVTTKFIIPESRGLGVVRLTRSVFRSANLNSVRNAPNVTIDKYSANLKGADMGPAKARVVRDTVTLGAYYIRMQAHSWKKIEKKRKRDPEIHCTWKEEPESFKVDGFYSKISVRFDNVKF